MSHIVAPSTESFSGMPKSSTSSPGVLYAVLTLLGELDAAALNVVKADVRHMLYSSVWHSELELLCQLCSVALQVEQRIAQSSK